MALVWQPGNYMFYGIHARTFRTRMPELVARGAHVTFGVDAAKVWTFGDLELIGYLVARQTGQYSRRSRFSRCGPSTGRAPWVSSTRSAAWSRASARDLVIRSASTPETVPAVNPVQELLLGAQATHGRHRPRATARSSGGTGDQRASISTRSRRRAARAPGPCSSARGTPRSPAGRWPPDDEPGGPGRGRHA